MNEPVQITITGDTEPVRETTANPGTVEVLPLFQAPQTIRGQLAMPDEPEPLPRTYVGGCPKCRHASRVAWTAVQQLDSGRWAKSARTGEKVLLTPDGGSYDPARPFILNGMHVCARCPDHGVYRMAPLRGRVVAAIRCDARCTGARGPKCDCSCGGHNHGADHS